VTTPPPSALRPGCPGPERLAAFLDGRADAAERAEIAAHLADCDACREIVVEARALAAELESGAGSGGGEVVAFPERGRRRPRRSLAWGAAAALLLAAAGLLTWLRPPADPGAALADLAAAAGRTPLPADWGEAPWTVLRSDRTPLSERASAFRLGARSADLELALALGDRVAARRFAAECASLLAAIPFADAAAESYRALAAALAEPAGTPARASHEAAVAWRGAREAVEPALFDLGRWAETERLIAATGRSGRPRRPPSLAAVPEPLAPLAGAAAAAPPDDAAARFQAFARLVAAGGDQR